MAERGTSLSTWFKRTPFNGKIIVKGELLETYEAIFGSIDEAISWNLYVLAPGGTYKHHSLYFCKNEDLGFIVHLIVKNGETYLEVAPFDVTKYPELSKTYLGSPAATIKKILGIGYSTLNTMGFHSLAANNCQVKFINA